MLKERTGHYSVYVPGKDLSPYDIPEEIKYIAASILLLFHCVSFSRYFGII